MNLDTSASCTRRHECYYPPASVAERTPTDAHGTDPAGSQIGVMLFVDDGYLSEVEIYILDDGRFAGLPDPLELKLSQWSDLDASGSRRLLNP